MCDFPYLSVYSCLISTVNLSIWRTKSNSFQSNSIKKTYSKQYLSIYLSFYLPLYIFLFIYPSLYLEDQSNYSSIYQTRYISIPLSIINLSVYLFGWIFKIFVCTFPIIMICLQVRSIYLSIYPLSLSIIYLSVYLSIHLYTYQVNNILGWLNLLSIYL